MSPTEIPAAAARATAVASIVAALVSFLTAKRRADEEFLTGEMLKRAPAEDVARVIADEQGFEQAFAEKAAARFAERIATALAIPDPTVRERAIRGVLAQEETYARQRAVAMAARAFAAIDRVVLREASPQGAFWKLDPTVTEHTAGCLVMGGKFWPWAVLDRVHPPRHHGCPCRLLSYGEAIADGLLKPGDVPSVRDAINMAKGIVMEAAEADALLAELDVRDLLVERRIATPESLARIPLVGVEGT